MSDQAFSRPVDGVSARSGRALVVVCGGTPWGEMPMSEHHIAARLTEWASVLYVNPPISVIAARRSRHGWGLRVVRPGLALYTPIVPPGGRRPGMVRIAEELARVQIRFAIRKLGHCAVRVLASDFPLYERGGSELRVLFATDDFVAGAELMGLPVEQIRRHESRLARESDLVIAVSEVIAEKWRGLGCRSAVLPNGCDTERFVDTDRAPWPKDVRLPEPIAGFAGQINDRVDVSLLEAVASRGQSLLMVGPVSRLSAPERLAALLARFNVQWVGPKEFQVMPSYLRAMRVGLTPYTDTPFNRASVPLKTVEYLAAGRAVVSTDLPAARELGCEHVTVATGAEAFADAVDMRLREPQTRDVVVERQAVAARHSWATRSRQFAEMIGVQGQTGPDRTVRDGVRAGHA